MKKLYHVVMARTRGEYGQGIPTEDILYKWRTGGGGYRRFIFVYPEEEIQTLPFQKIDEISTFVEFSKFLKKILPKCLAENKTIHCPKSLMGLIIGRKGWKIKFLSGLFGHIKVEEAKVVRGNEAVPNAYYSFVTRLYGDVVSFVKDEGSMKEK